MAFRVLLIYCVQYQYVSLPATLQTDRKEGGLGDLKYPLVADLKKVGILARMMP